MRGCAGSAPAYGGGPSAAVATAVAVVDGSGGWHRQWQWRMSVSRLPPRAGTTKVQLICVPPPEAGCHPAPSRRLTCHRLERAVRAAGTRRRADVVAHEAVLRFGNGLAADDAYGTRAAAHKHALQADARAAHKVCLSLARQLGGVAQHQDLLPQVCLHIQKPAAAAAGRGEAAG